MLPVCICLYLFASPGEWLMWHSVSFGAADEGWSAHVLVGMLFLFHA